MNLKFTAQGVPKEKIFPSGIPVRKEFYDQGDKAEAKEKLTKLLSGSMDETMELSIACGGKKAGGS